MKNQAELVSHLIHSGVLQSISLATSVMLKVDRAAYSPFGEPYADAPQTLGYGQTISAPHMHAEALSLLENTPSGPTISVLDVGCGSGYLTTAFARLAEARNIPKIRVTGIESIAALVEMSISNIKSADPDLLSKGLVEIHLADGWKGFAANAPYDFIHVGAAADAFPDELGKQLKPGGRLVVPMGIGYDQALYVCDKTAADKLSCSPIQNVLYVPLLRNPPLM